jgi:hypothetical protein
LPRNKIFIGNRHTHFTAYRLFALPNFVRKRGVLRKPLSKYRLTHFTAYRLFALPNFFRKKGILRKPLSKINRTFFHLSKNVAKIKVFIEATPKCRPAQPVYAKEK